MIFLFIKEGSIHNFTFFFQGNEVFYNKMLEFQLPGELILGLLQLLPLLDVLFLEVMDLCLDCLKLREQLFEFLGLDVHLLLQ